MCTSAGHQHPLSLGEIRPSSFTQTQAYFLMFLRFHTSLAAAFPFRGGGDLSRLATMDDEDVKRPIPTRERDGRGGDTLVTLEFNEGPVGFLSGEHTNEPGDESALETSVSSSFASSAPLAPNSTRSMTFVSAFARLRFRWDVGAAGFGASTGRDMGATFGLVFARGRGRVAFFFVRMVAGAANDKSALSSPGAEDESESDSWPCMVASALVAAPRRGRAIRSELDIAKIE